MNHLGYFLLTNLLLDRLLESTPARVVTVASLANVLFASELARRLAGRGVTSNSLHPGSVDPNFWSGAPLWAKPLIQLLLRPFFVSAEKGVEADRLVEPAPLARDEALARRLWDVSRALVGL